MPFQIIQSSTFRRWFGRLTDLRTRTNIDARLKRVSAGNFGDIRHVGKDVFELRVHYGPGYRVYFIQKDQRVIVLLFGGDKSRQRQDIARAQELAEDWRHP